jgi:bifunctional DNA-binding transcriptional regulator/antitoxin component of YhaV-PrlF toxin-antitoxin module
MRPKRVYPYVAGRTGHKCLPMRNRATGRGLLLLLFNMYGYSDMADLMRRTVQVAENGRMNLPAEMRRGLGLSGSGRVILTQDANGIRITTADQALKRVQALAAPFIQGRGSVVDEFIAERRAEAVREDVEAEGNERG